MVGETKSLVDRLTARLARRHDDFPKILNKDVVNLGEPKHVFPDWVTDVIVEHAAGFNQYPPNPGAPELLEAITGFVKRRYGVPLDAEQNVMALNGTREGLYNAVMALCPETKNGARPAILMHFVYNFVVMFVPAF